MEPGQGIIPESATETETGHRTHMRAQLEQMDVEVASVPREHKTKLQIKLRSYKGELSRYKAEVVRGRCLP